MKKIDKTKKNIKIESINDKTRKDLFNKFVKAGGEIIDEDAELSGKTGKKRIFDRNIQIAYRKKPKSYKKKTPENNAPSGKSNILKSRPQNLTKAYPEYKPGLLVSFSQRLFIRLRLFFMGITDFSGDIFNNKFFHLLNTEYKTSLIGIKLLYIELFKQNKAIEETLIYELDKIKTDYTRLIENAAQLYNEDDINNIISDYQLSNDTILPIAKYENDIILMFGKLYILKPYVYNILSAFNTAFAIHMKLTGKKESFYSKKRKNVRDDLYVIFEKLFQSLYWLTCRYHNRIIPFGSFEFEKLLKIKPFKTKIRKKKIPLTEETRSVDTEKQEVVKEQQENELSDEIKAGLMLMKDFTFNNITKLRREYDYIKTLNKLEDNDKMLLIYIILQEFDNEYSFLLTTSKIKYQFKQNTSENTGFKNKLLDFYDDIKKCMDTVKEYSEANEIFNKIKNEKLYSSERYIAHTKNLNATVKRREQTANSARFFILDLMNNIAAAFQLLINDINGEKKFINDPDEMIVFDKSIDGYKKLNEKTIHEAIAIAYKFASAYAFRLTTEGDLSGSLEFDSENTENKDYSDIMKKIDDHADKNKDPNIKEPQNDKSIIDEIDDLFTK